MSKPSTSAMLAVLTVLLGALAGGCGSSRPPVAGSSSTAVTTSTTAMPMTTTTPSTTTLSTVGLVACSASQLQIQLKGIQGATGNWAAAYWVADSSPRACLLRSPAKMNLLNSSGGIQLSATGTFTSLPLSADTPMPADNTVSSGQLAFLTLFWPTDADAELAQNGPCPTPDFVPAAIDINFGGSGAVTVPNTRIDGREVAICGQRISVADVGPLTPG
jgi:hypothetical protein